MRLATAAAALGLVCAGCGEDAGRIDAREPGAPVVAPQQRTARLAVVHAEFGNPPRFELVTMETDGGRHDVLVRAPRDGIERIAFPTWSPDAKRIYFIGTLREREGDQFTYYEADVFAVAAAGGEPERITTSQDLATVATSPDGRLLLVTRAEHPGKLPFTSGLWLVDTSGGDAKRLLEPRQGNFDGDAAWSPDATTIVFTRCRLVGIEAHCDVYAVGRDGSGLRKLAERARDAAFSPDGSSIAFVTDRDENGRYATGSDEDAYADELYVMDADGGSPRRLTRTHELSERAPAWSPDGTRIAFERTGPARFVEQVMVVAPGGGCEARIVGDAADFTENASAWESPAWRPGRIAGALPPLGCPASR
jgi:Tol biopolymer transport system component